MGMFAWIVFGFFAGLVARACAPGDQRMGFIKTTLLGVAGSFCGGTLASVLMGHPVSSLQSAGFLGSVVGALVLMVVARLLRRS